MKIQKWMFLASIVLFLGAIALVAFTILTPYALAQGPGGWFGPGFGMGPGRGSMSDGDFGPGFGMGRGRGGLFNGDFGPGVGMGGPGGDRGWMMEQGGRWGGSENSLIAIAAEKLGLTNQELLTELQAGKTVADVAAEKNVAVDTIVEAVLAPRTERLQEQVDNGQLTQEQADATLALMKATLDRRISEPWPQGRGLGYIDENGDCICGQAGQGPMGGHRGGGRMMGNWGW